METSENMLGYGAAGVATRIAAGDLSAAEVVEAHIARTEETRGDSTPS